MKKIIPMLFTSIGKWRVRQIEELGGWRKWVALVLLGLTVAVLGYAASFGLFILFA